MREIIIKTTPEKESTSNTSPIVISQRQKLFDAEAALLADEIVISANVISKASDEIAKESLPEPKPVPPPIPEIIPEPTPEPEPQKVLYSPEAALANPEATIFSWQKAPEKKLEEPVSEEVKEKSIEELKEEALDKAKEFVSDGTEQVVVIQAPVKKTSLVKKVAKTTGDMIVTIIFAISILIGGKTAFDYVQEAESIKRIATQLEAEYPSDIPPGDADYLSRFGQGGLLTPPADSAVNSLSPDAFVNIITVRPYYLLAKRNDGKIELRTGGSVGWRTNNPGKFGYGEFAKKTGAIGEYSKYAIYPTEKDGILALEVYLFGTNLYNNLSIQEAIKKFYSGEGEDAEAVAKQISINLNVSRYNTKLSSLSSSQRKTMIKTIADYEQNLKGIVRLYNDMEEYKQKGF